MEVQEIKNLVGRKVKVNVTGLVVNGEVLTFREDKYSYILRVMHDPVRWGDDIFTIATLTQRKCDGWGNIDMLEVV